MCGIAGLLNLRPGPAPDRDALARAIGALGHRGPDECGLYRDERAGLVHTRLSIIDLATGQQPLASADGTVWIVLNGEIFNYLELRAELEELGYRFRTRSDTEVFATAWAAWGEDALPRLNGQWAAALWRPDRGELALTRDRPGIRPLHYAERDGRVAFASEVKALFAVDPDSPRELDPVGIDQTLTFWTPVAPQTVFSGVRQLEPGHVRTYSDRGVVDRAYWQPSYFPVAVPGGEAESALRTRDALSRASSLRMLRADVPVGSYLSGGLDSSLVAALGSRVRGEPIDTFSIRFEDAEFDETDYQRMLVRSLGSRHRELVVKTRDIAEAFPDVIRHAEQPTLRAAPAPLYLLSGLVRDAGVKVVLTGEGADEAFAGYDLFREAAVRRFWARAPDSPMRPRLLERLYPYMDRSPVASRELARRFFGRNLGAWREPGFGHEPRWHATSGLKRLLSAEVTSALRGRDAAAELLADLPVAFGSWSHLAQDQYLEVRTLLSGYLLSAQGDRMLMAHSVEGRFPFLDKEVVELAASLPDRHKLSGLDEKHVLKRAAEGLVPEPILRRPKQPYRAPDALAFAGPNAPDWIGDLLSERALAGAGVFDPSRVGRLWAKCTARGGRGLSNTDNMALVAVLSTQLVHQQICGAPDARPPAEIDTVIDRIHP